ncbi:MAG: YdeI/OmpD-associated family protein, partial [Burkholderiales bacterium]|nr:YdeI/OmpD-associated family protein [Burkholderiales bacterium]
ETIKWSMPFFMHKGKMLAHMAAFKAHCAFDIHAGPASRDAEKDGEAMGVFGRVTTRGDLPSQAELLKRLKAGAAAIASGGSTPRVPKAAPKPAPEAPADLLAALAKNPRAKKQFAAFAPSHQREYVEWILEAKKPETRERRLLQAVDQIAEGKSRHWKYQDC